MPPLRWTVPIAVSLLALLRVAPLAAAQAEKHAGPEQAPSGAPRFFDRPVDYWQRGLSFPAPKETEAPGGGAPARSPARSAQAAWTEGVRPADGSTAVRELPRPLIQVLEDPSPEKIRAYFEWKWTRLEKILRAAEAMRAYRESLLESRPSDPDAERMAKKPKDPGLLSPPGHELPRERNAHEHSPPDPATLLYFHRAGCPHCDTQDAVLAAWLRKHPEVSLQVLEFGERPELWKRYAVRGTPSIVIESPGSSRSQLLEGMAHGLALEEALALSRKPGPASSGPKEGERK